MVAMGLNSCTPTWACSVQQHPFGTSLIYSTFVLLIFLHLMPVGLGSVGAFSLLVFVLLSQPGRFATHLLSSLELEIFLS